MDKTNIWEFQFLSSSFQFFVQDVENNEKSLAIATQMFSAFENFCNSALQQVPPLFHREPMHQLYYTTRKIISNMKQHVTDQTDKIVTISNNLQMNKMQALTIFEKGSADYQKLKNNVEDIIRNIDKSQRAIKNSKNVLNRLDYRIPDNQKLTVAQKNQKILNNKIVQIHTKMIDQLKKQKLMFQQLINQKINIVNKEITRIFKSLDGFAKDIRTGTLLQRFQTFKKLKTFKFSRQGQEQIMNNSQQMSIHKKLPLKQDQPKIFGRQLSKMLKRASERIYKFQIEEGIQQNLFCSAIESPQVFEELKIVRV